jgi:signal transduction histidine kinase/ActR/RegA family two-component response regulator
VKIGILAPTGRDGILARDVLRRSDIDAVVCTTVTALLEEIDRVPGALLIAEEALEGDSLDRVVATLATQPPWSDIPVLLLTGAEDELPTRSDRWQRLGNVTFIDRPVRIRALVSAVETALRARRRQEQVRGLLQQAEEDVRMRDRFLAMLGHELRNPLGAILYATELIRVSRTPELLERQRVTIERQTKHLSRLVDDLLDVSRVTTGKVVLKKRPVDLREIAQRCLVTLESAVRAQRLTSRLEGSPDPVWVEGDPVRLEQVLINLVVNAIKYTPPGGAFSVRVESHEGVARIAVTDNGIGIDAAILPRVFDLFAQAESSLDRSRGGLGIGLTLVRSLVALHGGEVAAHSDGPGRGSRFEIALPVLAVDVGKIVAAPAPRIVRPRRIGLRIVLIEDNADIREPLQELLESSGHHVEWGATGPDGVRVVLKAKPDVAIVDVGLPGFDGYEVARRVRAALGKSVLLVALTGYGQPEDTQRAVRAGFDHHMTKPVAMEDLEDLLDQLVEERQATPA